MQTHEKEPGEAPESRCGKGVHTVTLAAEGEAPTCKTCWRKAKRELSLADLSPDLKGFFRETLGKQAGGLFTYGFMLGGNIVITHAPLAEVHLHLEPTSNPDVALVRGKPVEVMPLILFGEAPVSFEYRKT